MTTQQIKRHLTEAEIAEQKAYALKFFNLIQKELAHGDLINLENVEHYASAYKKHMTLANDGYVMMPVFA